MITKNLIINQLPEISSLGTKQIRGLMTLNIGAGTTGTIRVFNVSPELLPLSVAIKFGTNKYVFSNILDPQDYAFSLPDSDPNAPITMLLASNSHNKVNGVAMATSIASESNFDDLFGELKQEELDELIDNEISQVSPSLCQSLVSEQTTLQTEENTDDQVADDSDLKAKTPHSDNDLAGNFYALIQPQLDELFSKFPHFRELEDLVANTQWVKINYAPNENQHYILGKLYDNNLVTHICYGIPAESNRVSPPESLINFCQWIPLSLSNPDGPGYWVMYQDAEKGENIFFGV